MIAQTPALPLAIPLGLAFAVWVVGVLTWARTPHPPTRPHLRTGTATELAPAIRVAPRAMVYVKCVWSCDSLPGLRRFEEAAKRLARERPEAGIQFFVIEEETASDSEAWAESFRDERLGNFGHQGSGWLLWLEHGRLREVDSHSGVSNRDPFANWERTLSLWP